MKCVLAALVITVCGGCRATQYTTVSFFLDLNFNQYGTARLEASSEKGFTFGLTQQPLNLFSNKK
ncbi:MAG: hypothetical protein KGJ06_01125 [Pseudomonadota bacterium]|nr:hypothetical protein [Pseudomonadota bacterium]